MTAKDVAHKVTLPPGMLDAARRGFYVFPTRPGGKEPRAALSWPRAACNDPARLMRATWRPGEGYGVAAKPSGLVIIDCDMPKPGYEFPSAWRDEIGVTDGADVLAVLAERAGQAFTRWPPDTYTVRTPSGGWHLYYRAPSGRPIGNRPLGPLVDIRGGGAGDGGYVVGAGSVIGGRAYEVIIDQPPAPLPASIADLLDPPRIERPGTASMSQVSLPKCDRYGRLRGLVQTVLDSTPGNRNGPLFWAACRAAEMVNAGEIDMATAERVLVDAAVTAGLRGGEHEARRTIASGFRQGAPA